MDESEGALPVQVQLQHALAKSSARVIDLFKEFDVDGDGTVSAKEFRIAMPLLGLNVPRADVDALFSSWDPDGSGTLTLKELEKVLRRPMEQAEGGRRRRHRADGEEQERAARELR